MSGNSKQRRQYRRRLARQGLTYIPPSDYRRRLINPDVYLEMPPVFSAYTYPPLTWAQLERRARRPGQRMNEIHVHDEVLVHDRDPEDPERPSHCMDSRRLAKTHWFDTSWMQRAAEILRSGTIGMDGRSGPIVQVHDEEGP